MDARITSPIPTVPVTKARRFRVIRPDLSRVEQICIAILRFIETHGRRMTLSQLRRGLNGHRHPKLFEAAIRELQDLGAVTIEKEPGSRRRWVTLVEVPSRFKATRPQPKRRRHRSRSRGQPPWFKSLIKQRTLEEEFVSLVNELKGAIREGQEEKSRQTAQVIVDRLRKCGA